MVTMKIDIHTHILPPEWPDFKERFGYGGFIRLEMLSSCKGRMLWDDGRMFREIESNCWDPHVRLAECDKNQVSVQVLSTVPVMFNYHIPGEDALAVAQFLNDHIAATVQQNPKRFVGLGTLPLQAPKLAVEELERCKRIGLSGIEIGTHIDRWNLSDAELFDVFACASELGLSIFVHPWDMMGSADMPKYWLPWLVGMPAELSRAICSMIFGGVFERLPKLRVAFAHGGGAFPHTLGRIEHGFRSRPDLCAVDNIKPPSEYLGRFFIDTIVHEPRALQYCLDVFGERSLALGSDYPFPLGESVPGRMIESMASLSPATKARLLSGTALEWLARKESDFR